MERSTSTEDPIPRPMGSKAFSARLTRPGRRAYRKLSRWHAKTRYVRRLPLRALLMILALVLVNLIVWAVCGIVLAYHSHLISTAALSYTLGLRHALDADHISAIDLMTRRLVATGQRPVSVGTFFSLGHSTIVVITSIVVAATAAGVSQRFEGFSNVGSIIGTSVSAAFLILLGIMNAYILYKLIKQLQKIVNLPSDHDMSEAWKIEGGGIIFKMVKKLFKLIDRPWKMYPLGVLFGLGFDTSSEIALLGISSIQGAQGTSMWLILIFPILFTVGMCLVDTIDGALMMSLYVAPMSMGNEKNAEAEELATPLTTDVENQQSTTPSPQNDRAKDPLTFLYYSIVLTTLTVVCAIVIGVIQLLSLILNVAKPTGPFWDGVQTAGDYYEVIGGAICGSFVLFGGLSVICYKPWRRSIERRRERIHGTPANGTGTEAGS